MAENKPKTDENTTIEEMSFWGRNKGAFKTAGLLFLGAGLGVGAKVLYDSRKSSTTDQTQAGS